MTTIYVTRPDALPARREHDHYPTERALIRAALERYAPPGFAGRALDPGAGDGRWGQALKALRPRCEVHGIELRQVEKPDGFDLWQGGCDYLRFRPWARYGLICGNPPYGPKVAGVPLAEHFIRHGFDLLVPGGRMIYLLPLQMQAGKDRYNNLWVTHPPTLVAVISPRPSFGLNAKGRRGTNGTDYGLFVWDKTPDGSPVGTARRWATELFYYEADKESKGE